MHFQCRGNLLPRNWFEMAILKSRNLGSLKFDFTPRPPPFLPRKVKSFAFSLWFPYFYLINAFNKIFKLWFVVPSYFLTSLSQKQAYPNQRSPKNPNTNKHRVRTFQLLYLLVYRTISSLLHISVVRGNLLTNTSVFARPKEFTQFS